MFPVGIKLERSSGVLQVFATLILGARGRSNIFQHQKVNTLPRRPWNWLHKTHTKSLPSRGSARCSRCSRTSIVVLEGGGKFSYMWLGRAKRVPSTYTKTCLEGRLRGGLRWGILSSSSMSSSSSSSSSQRKFGRYFRVRKC